ncbi:MAG: DUF4013 domain-containing protein [Planctomycetota bacterium]|nr:DUF4013 domain-containing protein [Planctomycetota bacterium]
MSIPARQNNPHYLGSCTFVFENPNWLTNVLYTGLCLLSASVIPILGQLVVIGYQFEIITALHTRSTHTYPDFEIDRLTHYLARGGWPFLAQLVVLLVSCALPLTLLPLVLWGGGGLGALLALAISTLWSLATGIFLTPVWLRAGFTRNFADGFDLGFARDFIARTWLVLLLSSLFSITANLLLFCGGLILCCIGTPFTQAFASLMHAHLTWQAYEIYLARGGQPIAAPTAQTTTTPQTTATPMFTPRFTEHVRRVMVLTVVAAEDPLDDPIATLQSCHAQLTGVVVERHQLNRDLELAAAAGTDVATYTSGIADHLSSEQKQTLIQAAFLTGTSDGSLQPAHLQQLQRLGLVLGFTDNDLRQIIAEVC